MTKNPFERLGPYVIERPLGSGGMGAVFLGVDERNGQRAAVKVLSPALAGDANFRNRFGTEVETLKKLKHPNIIQLLGYGEQDGQLFYAMEHVEGRTLQDELQSGRRFNWREVTKIGIEICQALKHAHDRGIIHRDLKPANLIYTEAEHVKLLDFGIAKLYGMSRLTMEGGVLGTVDYMSPEQGDGGGVTARSDLYSLGSVLFALLTGRPPFTARSAAEVMHKLRYDPPPLVRNLAPETPREFELIVAQLLEKDPHRRIATALAVANRLKAMEYALSVETRVSPGPDDLNGGDEEYRLADDRGAQPSEGQHAVTRATTAPPGDSPRSDQSLERHRNPTLAMSDMLDADTGLEETPEFDDRRNTHFTTFDEEAQQCASRPVASEEPSPLWLKIVPGILAASLIAVGLWYVTRPASPNRLYRKITAAVDEDDPRALSLVEDEMREFVERFSVDPRVDEIRALQEALALYRLQKRYARRARLRGGMESLQAVEQAYLEATRLAATDPIAAAIKLQALLDVYSGSESDKNTAQCLKLAREQLKQMRAKAKAFSENQLAQIQQRLDVADQLERTVPKQAAAIRHGVIELYGDRTWARPAVRRAREALALPFTKGPKP